MGATAIKALNLLRGVNSIKSEGHKYRKEFPELYTGIGRFQNMNKIWLKESAQTMSIETL